LSAPRRSADGGGSRHLTANEHWKSQIRHALYTSPRFARAEEGEDDWRVSNLDAPAPATTTVRVYPADEPKAGPAKPRGRPRKRVPGSDAAVAVAAGPERRIEESKDVRKKSIQVSNTKAPVVVPVPRVGPRPDPVARPPPLDARVGPPLGLAASASAATGAANLAKPVARLRDDDEHAAAGIENADTAFESPSKEGSSSKEEVTSPPPRRLAVSPPRRPFAAANENAPRSAAPPPANAPPADAPPPPLVSLRGASPERASGRATGADAAEPPEKRARVGKAPGPAAAKRTRASPPRAAPRLAGGPVLVMVGDKAVAPAARDRSVNRRKPASGRRAALPHGVHPISPPKRVVRRTSNTLSRLWETETRR
jgi:hypothetical protein